MLLPIERLAAVVGHPHRSQAGWTGGKERKQRRFRRLPSRLHASAFAPRVCTRRLAKHQAISRGQTSGHASDWEADGSLEAARGEKLDKAMQILHHFAQAEAIGQDGGMAHLMPQP